MATCLDDLLTTLDLTTADRRTLNPGDAARALDRTARLLARLRGHGLNTPDASRDASVREQAPPAANRRPVPTARDGAARRLADACAQAALTVEPTPGRVSELVAVTGDAVGSLGRALTAEDRWAAAVRLAIPARRCARAIAAGRYAYIPHLHAVADRSRELTRVAAMDPPDLARMSGHDVLLAAVVSPADAMPTQAVLDAVARLAADFRRDPRPPATVREIIGVCHAASVVADIADFAERSAELSVATAWRAARDTVALYSDGIPRPEPGQSELLLHAARLDHATRRAATDPNGAGVLRVADRHDLAVAARHLHHIARGCHDELDRIQPSLHVRPGATPLNEQRVGEWLSHKTFRVTLYDLRPALDALNTADAASAALAHVLRTGRQVELGRPSPHHLAANAAPVGPAL